MKRNQLKRPVIVPIGPSIAYVELTRQQWALIDSEDAIRVAQYNWHAYWNHTGKKFYAVRALKLPDGREIKHGIHREVLNTASVVDHISTSTLDNRKANLRTATNQQNCFNRRMPSTNTSGYKGVTLHKNGRWQASISRGKYRYLGLFDTPQKAHQAYCTAATELHGEFARTQ